MRSSVFTLFPPVVRGTLVLTGWSRHCRITAGLASMDVPLLVSLLSLSAGGAVRGSTAPVGWRGSPATSPMALLLAFRNGAPSGPLLRVFALSLRDGVTLPGRVCLSPRSDRRLLLHLPGVCFESSRWGHPVGSWFVPDLDRNEDLLAHLPLWLVSGLRDGVTHFGSSGSFLLPRSERRLPPFISP